MTPRTTRRRATTERLRRVIAASAFAALCGFSSSASPCGAFVSRDVKTVPSLAVEQTLLVYDEQKQLEHLIRQVAIRDPGPGFGFVVPTPEQPEVAKVAASPFEKLARAFPVSSGELRIVPGARGGGAAAAAAAPVKVLSQQRVGSFTAFVLSASDAASLKKWLSDNQFATSPETQAWLDHYVKLGFFFAALRYERPKAAAESGVTRAEVLRISFRTALPFYPYREPAHTPGIDPRDLAVWLVSPRRYVPVSLWRDAGGQAWKRPWLEHSEQRVPRADLSDLLGKELAKVLPASSDDLELQVFEDQKRDRRAFGDVVLVPAKSAAAPNLDLVAAGKLMKSLDPEYEAP
jgi:hypothetical protein